MWELILSGANLPFSVALAVMLALAMLEGVSTLLGAGLSNLLESVVPDLDVDVDLDLDLDADIDADLDLDLGIDADAAADAAPGDAPLALSRFLGWLRVGEVPLLVLLVIFLTAFGLIGLTLQAFIHSALGTYLPAMIAVVPALLLALPTVRFAAGVLAPVLPRDETEAVDEASFLGRSAVVTLGTARHGSPAQARLRDDFGKTHYVMVEPLGRDIEFPAGMEVLLRERKDGLFRGEGRR